jgi:hypothetical protein
MAAAAEVVMAPAAEYMPHDITRVEASYILFNWGFVKKKLKKGFCRFWLFSYLSISMLI